MLNYPNLSFRLLSKQRRKVRIYIILELHLRKKFMAPLPLLINPSYWNSKTQRVISSHKNSSEINRKLKILQDQFTKNHDLENLKSLNSFKNIVELNYDLKQIDHGIMDEHWDVKGREMVIESLFPYIKGKKKNVYDLE